MKEMIFACPSCDQHIQCDAAHAGENIPCPSCAVLIRVPIANAIAEVEVPTPASALAPDANDAVDDPFNNATSKSEAVSYTSLKTPAESAETTDANKPAKAVESAPEKVEAAPTTAEPPTETTPAIPHDVYCICPSCHAELRVPAESLEQPPGTLVSTEVVRPSPAQAPPAPVTAKSEAESSESSTGDAAERERKIASAREHMKIQANPTVKPRLSYILTGGEAPAKADNNAVHDPVPEADDSNLRSLSE
jgi:hypothetical protein